MNFFTNFQKKIITSAVTLFAFIAIVAMLFYVFSLASDFLFHFRKVIWPLIITSILALMVKPLVSHFENKLKLNRFCSIALVYVILILSIGIFGIIVIPIIVEQLASFIKHLPIYLESILSFVKAKFPDLLEKVSPKFENLTVNDILPQIKNLANFTLPAISVAGQKLLSIVSWAAAFVAVPIYLYYILESKTNFLKTLENETVFLRKKQKDEILYLIDQFSKIIVCFFRGQLLIGIILGLLLGTAFSIVGVPFGFVLGITAGFLNVIPYMGTAFSVFVILPLTYFSCDLLTVTLPAVIVYFAVDSLQNYYLMPRIMGNKTGLPAGAIVFSIFFWGVALDGVLGMILAVPLSAFFVVFWRLIKKNYFSCKDDIAKEEKSEKI